MRATGLAMVLVRCKWGCEGDDLKRGMNMKACEVGVSGCATSRSLSLGTAAERVFRMAGCLTLTKKK